MSKYQVWIHASEILTGVGVRKKDGRRIVEADLGKIQDGALVLSQKRDGNFVEWVGPTAQLPKKYQSFKKTDLKGKRAIVPSFVDCHTHLVFAGDRSNEFARRSGGVSYETIAKEGGGIVTTVGATRKASAKELERLAILRVKEAQSFGISVLEIKTGYGLDFLTEIKCLEVVAALKRRFPNMLFQTTFLGAHAFPKEMSRDSYVAVILDEMLPHISKKGLADACDVFVDEGYFTRQEAKKILKRALSLGLKIKIHADELGETGSTALAVELGCLSADHLLKISDDGIQAISKSDTVAVLLPGTAFYLKATHAPARKLLDAGTCVALSTDFNPGTSMTLNLPAIMTTAALYLGMTRAEIFAAVTYNAAKALGLEGKCGTIEEGIPARIAVLPFEKFEDCYYRFGWSTAQNKIILAH